MIKLHLFIFVLLSPLAVAAENCPAGSTWVKPHPRDDFYRATGVYVSATYVTGHCRSKSKAYEFWSPLLSNGRPENWPFSKEVSATWTAGEIERFISAAEKIPSLLRQQVKVFRMKNSSDNGNLATSSEGTMVLYDNAFLENDLLSRVIVHELSHELYRNLPLKQKDKFQKVMKWSWVKNKRNPKGRWSPGRVKYVTRDSDTSPEEDFANGVEFYLFERTRLKYKDPMLYNWLSSTFADKLKLE